MILKCLNFYTFANGSDCCFIHSNTAQELEAHKKKFEKQNLFVKMLLIK